MRESRSSFRCFFIRCDIKNQVLPGSILSKNRILISDRKRYKRVTGTVIYLGIMLNSHESILEFLVERGLEI
jgi:hypothetical protein